ncbi:MAG: fasciclin domain-containing protein [Ignavibacteriales bacterium]|nr:fasciclin domain-containing protein [Ignavibacteriota bacterium]MCB9249950.1 fasciclin domain-containing protein [Ignavibacteriales bacterium]
MDKYINKIAVGSLIALTVFFFASALIANDNEKETTEKRDIVTIAVEAGTFNTLATALTEANLIETLKGEGPFTVFAPTDEAFAKLPEGTVETLLKDKEALTNILLYHVVSGNVSSSEVVKLDAATTIAKSDVSINVKDGKVFINDSQVTTADVMASNGVIHIIDTVLIPESSK